MSNRGKDFANLFLDLSKTNIADLVDVVHWLSLAEGMNNQDLTEKRAILRLRMQEAFIPDHIQQLLLNFERLNLGYKVFGKNWLEDNCKTLLESSTSQAINADLQDNIVKLMALAKLLEIDTKGFASMLSKLNKYALEHLAANTNTDLKKLTNSLSKKGQQLMKKMKSRSYKDNVLARYCNEISEAVDEYLIYLEETIRQTKDQTNKNKLLKKWGDIEHVFVKEINPSDTPVNKLKAYKIAFDRIRPLIEKKNDTYGARFINKLVNIINKVFGTKYKPVQDKQGIITGQNIHALFTKIKVNRLDADQTKKTSKLTPIKTSKLTPKK